MAKRRAKQTDDPQEFLDQLEAKGKPRRGRFSRLGCTVLLGIMLACYTVVQFSSRAPSTRRSVTTTPIVSNPTRVIERTAVPPTQRLSPPTSPPTFVITRTPARQPFNVQELVDVGDPTGLPEFLFATVAPRRTSTPTPSNTPRPTNVVALMPTNTPLPLSQQATVVEVIDGDTISVLIDGERYSVRYIGINAPESNQQCGVDATAANTALVGGEQVILVADVSNTDRFGRLLRYVYVRDLFVNAEMVRMGYAQARAYEPDIAQDETLQSSAQTALAANIGCYAQGLWGGTVINPATGGGAQPVDYRPVTPQTWYITANANGRSCASTTCAVVARLAPGQEVRVIGEAEGDQVGSSTVWRVIEVDGETVFVHSSLISNRAPIITFTQSEAPPPQQAGAGEPAPVSTAPPYACNCSRTCGQMTCNEAYYQLQVCGCSERDADSDGRPCEQQCGG
jgi:endonuclease YncB( thermonuclease family)